MFNWGSHNRALLFSGVCVAESFVFCVVFCRALFFFWWFSWYPLYCLSFDVRSLTTPLVSSNCSCMQSFTTNENKLRQQEPQSAVRLDATEELASTSIFCTWKSWWRAHIIDKHIGPVFCHSYRWREMVLAIRLYFFILFHLLKGQFQNIFLMHNTSSDYLFISIVLITFNLITVVDHAC